MRINSFKNAKQGHITVVQSNETKEVNNIRNQCASSLMIEKLAVKQLAKSRAKETLGFNRMPTEVSIRLNQTEPLIQESLNLQFIPVMLGTAENIKYSLTVPSLIIENPTVEKIVSSVLDMPKETQRIQPTEDQLSNLTVVKPIKAVPNIINQSDYNRVVKRKQKGQY